ncbi:hypothetical protein ACQ4PT_015907 [Festuca glaucescens]
MDRALEEETEKHAPSIGGDVDAGAVGGTVVGAADGMEDPPPAKKLPVVFAALSVLQPVAEVPEADLLQNLRAKKVSATAVVTPLQQPVAEVPKGSCVIPRKAAEHVESEADLLQNLLVEKVSATAAVAPLQQPVAEFPEGSCVIPRSDGEDVKQVVDDVQVEIPTPDAATSMKREYGVGAWMSHEDPGFYSSECEYDSDSPVDDDNKASFGRHIRTKLEEGDLKIEGVYKLGKEWFTCPFCPNKPDDGLWKALAHHSQSLALNGSTMKIRVQHDVLTDFMCGNNRPNVVRHADKKRRVF